MKKLICLLICCMLIMPVLADNTPVDITFHPQNYTFPENGTVSYTVRASGSNLRAFWFLEYEGVTYELPAEGESTDPWTAQVGGSYGAFKDGEDFHYYFNNVKAGLSGAKIWCTVEDGHYDMTSAVAIISIGGTAQPPEIKEVPAYVNVTQGQSAELRCVAASADESQLEFLWYETTSGRLQDIVAVNRGAETSDFLFADTSTPGVRYYVCMVTTSNGGSAYSSVIPVNVMAAQVTEEPTQQTVASTEETALTEETTVPTEETVLTEETTVPTEETVLTEATTVPTEETAPTEETLSTITIGADTGKPTESDLTWLWILITALAAAGIGAGATLLVFKKKK